MNMTSMLIDRPNFRKNLNTKKENLETLGIIDFSRTINIFFKENKNTFNIKGHNIVTSIGCLITNKSIYYFKDDSQTSRYDKDKTVCTKTVYLCDIEFPNSISVESVKKNINKFLGTATVKPLYAFSNSIIQKHFRVDNSNKWFDSTDDLGLTMVDLNVSETEPGLGIINFSKNSNEFNNHIINMNHYNPKYYNFIDCVENGSNETERSGIIDDFIDSKTKIIYNTFGSEIVDNFDNNVQKTGIYINKRTIFISDFIKSLFEKILFLPIEEFTFIFDSLKSRNTIQPTIMKTFSRFNDKGYIKDCANKIISSTINCCEKLYEESKTDFKLISGIDKNFIIVEVHFYDTDKTIRITKPLYKLYGEFALNSEQIANEIDLNSDIIKSDMLETSVKNMLSLESARNIAGMINLIDSHTHQLKMMLEDSKSRIVETISDDVSRRMLLEEKDYDRE